VERSNDDHGSCERLADRSHERPLRPYSRFGRSRPSVVNETDRLEAFSDAVMAVIITIMAFNVKPPTGASFSAVRASLPELLVYVLSFAIIGTYWNNHHHLLRATHRMSGGVMWSNLHLLFWLSLLPVATGWVGLFPGESVPSAFYGVVGVASALAYWILVRAIIRANGADSRVARRIGSDLKGQLSPVLYAAGVGLAFVIPVGSYVVYAAVAVMWLVPDRRLAPQTARADIRETL
jgi:uncharacterized membrane protein